MLELGMMAKYVFLINIRFLIYVMGELSPTLIGI